jgi:hypothetical protein
MWKPVDYSNKNYGDKRPVNKKELLQNFQGLNTINGKQVLGYRSIIF